MESPRRRIVAPRGLFGGDAPNWPTLAAVWQAKARRRSAGRQSPSHDTTYSATRAAFERQARPYQSKPKALRAIIKRSVKEHDRLGLRYSAVKAKPLSKP